jgi:anti-sigma regulatory factor (Ser/Thr protein kinase)
MTKAAGMQQPGTRPPLLLRTHLELAAYPSAVPCARGHTRSVVLEWGLRELAESAELLASELVTNAVQASSQLKTLETPVVRLWLISDRISIVIHVWDGSDEMPVRQGADADKVSGRGLVIVDYLSSDWGAYRKESGKVVWARITSETVRRGCAAPGFIAEPGSEMG